MFVLNDLLVPLCRELKGNGARKEVEKLRNVCRISEER